MNADLIVKNIGQLVTCASPGGPKRGDAMRDVGIIAGGAVAVENGLFVAVGYEADVLSNHCSDNVIDAGGKAVCPGFVDPHTHIVFAGDRLDEFELKIKGANYLEILGSGGGILSTVRKTREAAFENMVESGRSRLDKMLACGTTTAEVKTGYGLETEAELKMLCVIDELDQTQPISLVPTFLAAHTVPSEYNGNTEGYVDLVCSEMMPAAWEWYEGSHFAVSRTPFFVDVFCEQNAFDRDEMLRMFSVARGLGFQVKAHVDQFTNLGASAAAIRQNAVSIDHLDAISEREIAELAASGTIGIVIPTENFSAGKTSFANARGLIDAGCAVAISTDYNPGSAPCPSMPMTMAIACRYQKLLPSEAMNTATINAAHGIGLGATCGSIEIGKQADFIILDGNDYRQLAYEFGLAGLSSVYIGGAGWGK